MPTSQPRGDEVRLIEARGLHVNVSVPSEPLRIEADPTRLEQVFVNLLSNAAKYTDAGGPIDLIATREGDDAVVRIQDTGIGIAPEMLPRLWDLFAQSNRALDRAQGGLGIGLTIACRLIDRHAHGLRRTAKAWARARNSRSRFPSSRHGSKMFRGHRPRPRLPSDQYVSSLLKTIWMRRTA